MTPVPGGFDTRPGPRPLRVLVVGAGAMGLSWLRAVLGHGDLELVGIIDADVRRAKGAAIRLRCPDVPVAEDLDALADTADACINVTPPSAHFTIIRSALRRGLSVLSEKPFAETMPQALELSELAHTARRLLMISQSRRYEPGLSALRRLADGLGHLGLVTTEFRVGYPASGFRAEMDQPLLLDMAVHAFDAARYVTASEPVAVYCHAFNPTHSSYRGPAAATAVFEMTGGVQYAYTGSWCFDGMPTSWSGRWSVSGERGTAQWDGVTVPTVDASTGTPAERLASDAPVAGGADPTANDPVVQVGRPLADFVRALHDGTDPSWGESSTNLMSFAMAQAAIVSARHGARVLVADVLDEARRTVRTGG